MDSMEVLAEGIAEWEMVRLHFAVFSKCTPCWRTLKSSA
jgi:hypothetical protein